MGLTMSISLVTLGNIMSFIKSGRFNPVGYLISLFVGIILSYTLGALVPMKKIGDAVNKKLHLVPHKLPGRLVQSLISSVLYTPILCFLGVYLGTTMGSMQIDRAISNLETQVIQAEQQLQQVDKNDMSKVKPLEGQIAGQKAKIEELKNNKPALIPAYLTSLPISFVASYILSFIIAPIYQKLIFKHYNIM